MGTGCLECGKVSFKTRKELHNHQDQMHGGRRRPDPNPYKNWVWMARRRLRETDDYETKKKLLEDEREARSAGSKSGKREPQAEKQQAEASMREWFNSAKILAENTQKNKTNALEKSLEELDELEKPSKVNTQLNMEDEESGKAGKRMKGRMGPCTGGKRRKRSPPPSDPPPSDSD